MSQTKLPSCQPQSRQIRQIHTPWQRRRGSSSLFSAENVHTLTICSHRFFLPGWNLICSPQQPQWQPANHHTTMVPPLVGGSLISFINKSNGHLIQHQEQSHHQGSESSKVVNCHHNESEGGHHSKEEQQRGRKQKLTISILPTTHLVTPQKQVCFFYKVFLIKQLIYIIILGSWLKHWWWPNNSGCSKI